MNTYQEAYNKAISRGNSPLVSEAIALIIESKNPIQIISSQIIPTESKIVFNSTGKEITFEGILADTSTFVQSTFPYTLAKFSSEALEDIANQINSLGSTAPDIDHEVGVKLEKLYGKNTRLIMNAIPQHKGMLKNIQAIYKDGKLWIKGTLDEKYRSILPRVKGLSIESIIDDCHQDTITKSKYLGFTLSVNSFPKINSAKITKYS